jgi:thiamine pyrophosphokinase
MAVLEVVAQAALTHALTEGDDSVDKSLIAEIREAMHDKCGEMKLDRTDARAAVFYAEELICAAIQASHIVRQ